MHANNSSYLVEIGVQGQCSISCRKFQIVQVMHADRKIPNKIVQFKLVNFLINRGLILKETTQRKRSLACRKIG